MKIQGRITTGTNSALSGCRVVAYHGDVNLKKEKRLGVARIDKGGAYSLVVDLAR